MKKFLSVLLALAVAFTFTFGSTMSAFASTTNESEYDALVEQAASQVTTIANTAYGEAVKAIGDTNAISGVGTPKAAFWQGAAPLYQAKIADLVAAKEKEIKNLYKDETKVALNALGLSDVVALFAIASGAAFGSESLAINSATAAIPSTVDAMKTAIIGDADVELATAKAYTKDLIDTAIVTVKGINTSVYSDTVNPTTKLSSAAMADAMIAESVSDMQKLDVDGCENTTSVGAVVNVLGAYATSTYSAIDGSFGTAAGGSGILADYVKGTDETYGNIAYSIVGRYKDTVALVTKKAEADANNSLAAKKASYVAKVEANYAAYLATNTTDAAKEEAAAYKAGVTEIINAQETTASLTAIFADENSIVDCVGGYFAKDAAKIAALEVFANKYIAAGYDADAIAAEVAAAKVAAYSKAAEWTDAAKTESENAIKAAKVTKFDTTQIDAAVAAAEVALAAIVDADPATYYAPELEQVKALYNTIIAELKACTSDEELLAVKTKYNVVDNYNNPTGLSTIKNKTAVKNAIRKTATGTEGWNANYQAVQAYGVYLNSGLTPTADGYRDFVGAGYFTKASIIDQDALADIYAEAGARTTAEAYAKIADAKAALEAVKTNSEVNAAKAAVEAQIAALPEATAITAADADAVKAAWEAAAKLTEETGAKISATAQIALDKAVTAAVNAVTLDINKAKAEFDAKTPVAADADAIKALIDRIADYNDNIGTQNAPKFYYGKNAINPLTLKQDLDALRAADQAEVVKAINALPLKITEADVAQVEAAKALYDAYVAKYTDYKTAAVYYTDPNANAANDFSDDLKNALNDAVIAASEVAPVEPAYDNQDAKADLLDMSRKLTIWRTSKTSIKVTAVGSVKNIKDNGYTVQYKFYKKAPGATSYKLVKTTSSNKYTYTNLKKGTNKFQVKVVVKDADGKVVASKWTYYRAAKIK